MFLNNKASEQRIRTQEHIFTSNKRSWNTIAGLIKTMEMTKNGQNKIYTQYLPKFSEAYNYIRYVKGIFMHLNCHIQRYFLFPNNTTKSEVKHTCILSCTVFLRLQVIKHHK